MLCHAACCDAAAVASGRNWRISVDSIECRPAESLLVIGTRIRYLGPKGPVEAPVSRLVDGEGKQYLPKSLVWKSGSKALAQWLASGGLANVQSENIGEVQLKFEAGGATGGLDLEFGDIKAFSLTRKKAGFEGACESLLEPGEIQAPRAPRPARVEKPKLGFPVHRARYPCVSPPRALQIVAAEHPPYLPRQLLLFGRGYLPNARQVDLPMGRAAAQPYSYAGLDNIVAVEDAARRAVLADFPEYANRSKYFAFNWGTQRSASGNEVYSIGIYDVRPCPK
jgi:hypothetical protein